MLELKSERNITYEKQHKNKQMKNDEQIYMKQNKNQKKQAKKLETRTKLKIKLKTPLKINMKNHVMLHSSASETKNRTKKKPIHKNRLGVVIGIKSVPKE